MPKILESRRYQVRAQEAFPTWYNSEDKLATIILPTGVGKTYTCALCLKTIPGLKILWTAHREELIDQAYEALKNVLPTASICIEMAERKADPTSDIVVGSVQTISKGRKHFDGFEPDIIVIDEYHHYSEENIQYDGLLKRWPKAKVLGLTATPWRFSGEVLPLGKVLIQMDIGTAIDKKYLVPPKAESLITGVSLSEVKTRMGDFATKDLSKAVNVESRNKMIAKRVIEMVRDAKRQGILFAVDVEHSKAMYELLRNEVRAAEVYGETPTEERRLIMQRIRNGEIDVLCNNLVCLDDQTEILTKTGWVGISEILPTHDVANWDNGKIWFEPPKNIIIRERAPDEKMVTLETRRRSIRVTDKHKLLYKTSPLNNWSKTEAINLCDKRIFVPVSGNSEPVITEKKLKTNRLSPRRISANAYNLRKKDKDLSIAESHVIAEIRIKEREKLSHKLPNELSVAECKFIGFWLGDGTRTKLQSGGVEYKITQSESNKNIIKWFDQLIFNLGYDVIRKEKLGTTAKRKDPHITVSWSFSRGTGFGSQKRKGLYEIESFLDKNGSDLLWGLNEKQFGAFIEGYWLADGNHKDASDMNCLVIHGVNLKLFDKLQALAVCRGYRCSIKQYDNHGSILYLLSLTKTCHHQMTRYKLQIESGWKQEKVWCVTTTSGNIITRRNRTVTIMGNCTEGFDVKHLSFVGQARPTKSLGLYTQMIGRGLRTSWETNKTDCIVIDVHDKVKVKQSRITFSDMAVAGDIYGDKKRSSNILKAEVPVEEVSNRLKNFPIFINKNKADRWVTDDESFSVSAWVVGTDQWIVTWTAETKEPKIISRAVFEPWIELPSPMLELYGRPVKHTTFGAGKVIKVVDRDNPKILVEFDNKERKVMEMTSLSVQKYVKEYSPSEIETTKTDKLFFICAPDSQENGRVIHFIKEGWNSLTLKEDKRISKLEIDSYLQGEAMKDGILQLVRTNAKWKFGPASDKQKSYVEKMYDKIGFDIDLDTLTKGDASAIIEQIKWQDIIHKKFGTNYKEKLLGYDPNLEDV